MGLLKCSSEPFELMDSSQKPQNTFLPWPLSSALQKGKSVLMMPTARFLRFLKIQISQRRVTIPNSNRARWPELVTNDAAK